MSRFHLLIAAVLVCFVSPAAAQNFDIADAEQVAIAFYKFAGLEPRFSSWAEDTQAYHNAPPMRRDEVREKEVSRLRAMYESFSKSGTLLNVATKVRVTVQEGYERRNETRKVYTIVWSYPDEETDFFPYRFRNMYFALIPRRMNSFHHGVLTLEQYEQLKKRIGAGKEATLILQLRGKFADGATPLHRDEIDFWGLSATIAGASLWDEGGQLLWEDTASEYLREGG